MSSQLAFFLLLSFLVLVPIVPAYLLFRILPSTGNVQGTFKGMEIKLGGAFAGYFVLVCLIIAELPKIKEVVNPSPTQVWEVEGQLVDENGEGIQPLERKDITFQPDSLNLNPNGWFKITFATQLTRTAAGVEFPRLNLGHDGYKDMSVDLGPPPPKTDLGAQAKRDEINHLIILKSASLKKLPVAYSTSGPLPPSVSPAAYAASTEKASQGAPPQ